MVKITFEKVKLIVITNYKTIRTINGWSKKYIHFKLLDDNLKEFYYNNLSEEDQNKFYSLEKNKKGFYITFIDINQIFTDILKEYPHIKIIEI